MKVVLQQPHEHAGIKHPAGAEIEVSQSDAEWLEKQDVIAAGKRSLVKTDINPTEVTQ
jgi:hypothetical protein